MILYVSVTREPADSRTWLTPVCAVHLGVNHGEKLGVRTFSGENMWKDLHSDLTKICGAKMARCAPSRRIIPCGWNAGLQWGIIMTNFVREGLSFYDMQQPTTKKWQEVLVSDLSRIFTQCSWIKDAELSEKEAFDFMGLSDAYFSEDERYQCLTCGSKDCEQAIGIYMNGLATIRERYVNLNPMEQS